jgi:hypothetical protein
MCHGWIRGSLSSGTNGSWYENEIEFDDRQGSCYWDAEDTVDEDVHEGHEDEDEDDDEMDFEMD